MAVDKSFVVKNGLEVNSDLIVADANSKKVGIASTGPRTTLDVRGGIAASDFSSSGVSTFTSIGSNLIPDADGTRNIGAATSEWGDLFLDGTATVDALVADTAKVSDLTDNRVVIAGTDGELEDSGNLTFDGSTLAVTGDQTVSSKITVGSGVTATAIGGLSISGIATIGGVLNATGDILPSEDGSVDLGSSSKEFQDLFIDGTANIDALEADTAKIGDLTDNRVVIAGSSGELEDSANLTFDGSTLAVTGDQTVSSKITVGSGVTIQSHGGVSIAGIVTIGGDLNVTGDINYDEITGRNLNITGITTFADTVNVNGDINLGNATSDTITATGRFDSDIVPSTDGTRDLGASGLEFKDLYIDGTANIDSLSADTAAIGDLTDNRVVIAGTSGELEDDSNLTYDGTDLSTNSLIVGDLTDNRVVIAGTSGAVEDSANLTFNGSLLAVTGDVTASNVNASGITTASAFAGFDYLQAPFGSTVTFTVTVATKTSAHRYNGTGSSNGYVINGTQAPFIVLVPGRTYRFDQADSTNSGHPLRFYEEADKTTAYTNGVTTNGTPGSAGAYTQIVVGDDTRGVLHYQCSSHAYMGNAINNQSASGSGGGTPGGSDTQVQFNDGGNFGGSAKFTFNSTTGLVTAHAFRGDEFIGSGAGLVFSPSFTAFSPSDGATGVAATHPPNIVFTTSQEIFKVSGGGNITIREGSATGTAAQTIGIGSTSATISGQTLTVIPTGDLKYEQEYYVVLDQGILENHIDGKTGILSTYNFTTEDGPSATTFIPADGDTNVAIGTNITITYDKIVQLGSGNITLRTGSNSGSVIETIAHDSGNATVSGKILTINPASDLPNFNDTYVVVDAGFIQGADAINTYNFETEQTAGVSAFAPGDGTSNVGIGTTIKITYDANVTIGSTGFITLRDGSATGSAIETYGVVSGNTSVSGAVLTIDPTSDFSNLQDVFVVIDKNYLVGIDSLTTYNFTTEPGATPSSFSPADGATGVAVNSNIVITYDRNISIGTGNVTLRNGSASGTVIETITHDGGLATVSGTDLTLNPASDLPVLTDVYVVIDDGFISSAAELNTYNFTTQAGATPSSFSPSDGSTNVSRTTSTVSVTYDQSISIGSGTATLRTGSASGTIIQSIASGSASVSGSTLSFTISSDFAASTTYYLVIPSGFVAGADEINDWNWTTQAAPSVSAYHPANGETNTERDTVIYVTFNSTQLHAGTGNVTVRSGSSSGPIHTQKSTSQCGFGVGTLSFGLSSNLSSGTSYYVNFPAGFEKFYTSAINYSFTTAAARSVTSQNPSNGATGVSASTQVAITFNGTIYRGDGYGYFRSGSNSGSQRGSFSFAHSGSGHTQFSGSTLTILATPNSNSNETIYVQIPFEGVKGFDGLGQGGTTANYSFAITVPPSIGDPLGGGYVAYLNGTGNAVLASPPSSETQGSWSNRNAAVTAAQSNSGVSGWFFPSKSQWQSYVGNNTQNNPLFKTHPQNPNLYWINQQKNSTHAYGMYAHRTTFYTRGFGVGSSINQRALKNHSY
tara:strand:- start:12366 stop:16946 length:4581 start_codon:yes stop_codon:yes gene_type:complete